MVPSPPNAAVAVSQHVLNASATPSQYFIDTDDRIGTNIWQSLRIDTKKNREHPSVYWCTSKDYVKKRAVAVPPRLPYFDASSWCFVPEPDPTSMQRKTSHLLSLPREVRTKIWKYVLTEPSGSSVAVEITRAPLGPGKTSLRFPHPCIKLAIQPPRNKPISIDLLATNDLIYREALPVLYQSIKFAPLDVGSIFPVFLGTLSSFAQSNIRTIKLQVPSTVYNTVTFSSPFTLPNWAITCAQVAKLDALEVVEVEGYKSQFSSKRVKDGILNPLCKIKAKKIFDTAIDKKAQEALAEAEKELQNQASVRRIRTLSEAAERAERDALQKEQTLQQEELWKRFYSHPVLPAPQDQTAGTHEFEAELQEHQDSYPVFETAEHTEDIDLEIDEWEMISLKSGACKSKANRRCSMSDEEDWTDTTSTLVETSDGDGNGRRFSCFSG
jgi:hypothetical protein